MSLAQRHPDAVSSGAPEIDPRSFHAFEIEGDFLLFDRNTGNLIELNGELFGLFGMIEAGRSPVEACSAYGLSEERTREFSALLGDLKGGGHFEFVEVNLEEQDLILRRLLNHHPRRIQLLMAQGCNLGCRYCYAWRNGSNQLDTLMGFDVARASVDHLVRRSGQRPNLQITFFGGEALLNFETIRKVVAYCRDIEESAGKTFYFEVVTNGTLLDDEVIAFVVKERFRMMISIDGDEEMHNYNRPSLDGRNMYPAILSNARKATEAFRRNGMIIPKVRANVTSKYHDYGATGEYLYGQGFHRTSVATIEPLPHGDPSPGALTEEQCDEAQRSNFREKVEAIRTMAGGGEVSPYMLRQLRLAANPREIGGLKGVNCGIARNTSIVDIEGNIYPCHRYEGMREYIVGNVFTGMDDEKTLAYYRKINRNATDRCHDCWIRDYCAGGCSWLLSDKEGRIHDPTESECDRRRRGFENGLWMRKTLKRVRPDWFDGQGGSGERQTESQNEKAGCRCSGAGEGCAGSKTYTVVVPPREE